ncbi:MAG: inositol phosphorylceramide synthase [Proteobacteria bacterium]|nr:inositol phosphorylceramide synthase [Pseudomonadota bacterium]MCP4917532.1 inositol phosphorylceramide synthase [Pseudomonadota bacterium]
MPLIRVLREHAVLISLVGAYVATGYAVDAWLGDVMRISLRVPAVEAILVLFVILFLSGHAFSCLPRTPEGSSAFRFIWQDLRTNWLQRDRLVRFAIVYALLPFFFSTFGALKFAIPRIRPFDRDELFHAWDIALHGGPPFEYTVAVLGSVHATVFINVLYNLWIFLLFSIVIWQAFTLERRIRMQFLISFVLTWMIGGTLMAMWLSSVGPCYWGPLLGDPNPYAPLMHHLHAVHADTHLWAIDVQEQLWAAYSAQSIETVAGISAMPSMHVATSTLFALLGWARHRVLGVALTVFALCILVGSVHLGWHYAVDGYIGAAIAAAIWFGVGAVQRLLPGQGEETTST